VQHDRPQIGCERDAASDERYPEIGQGTQRWQAKSRKQAIAIGLSEARKKGATVPRNFEILAESCKRCCLRSVSSVGIAPFSANKFRYITQNTPFSS
jgi:hypothetical protein